MIRRYFFLYGGKGIMGIVLGITGGDVTETKQHLLKYTKLQPYLIPNTWINTTNKIA